MKKYGFIISCGIVFYLFVTFNYPFLDLLIDQAKAAGNFTSENQIGITSKDLLLSYTIETHHWNVTRKTSTLIKENSRLYAFSHDTHTSQNPTQKNKVPSPTQKAKPQQEECVITHIVKPGDTLCRISSKYGVKISTISKLNGLKGSILPLGMKLKIMNEKQDTRTS